jgi:dipeptidyl aminopeptidase/acylaminoacyl peptidase
VRLAPGTRLGPYEILELLGAGGMGEVYRARDTRLGRDVALKMVSEPLGADPALLERFQREARLAGALNHPNVVALYDVGAHDRTPFFITELLRGETLRSRLERGALPLATALEIAGQLAAGLAAAHEQGIVHRDIKPENVFLTREGRAKLLDFGIAKAVEAALEPGTHGMMETTAAPGGGTRAGAVFGSPGYMSPEQVRGDAVDARTDFFSFGAVLSEMLTGRRAFPGSLLESGQSILHDAPPPLPDGVPEPVVQVVQRCLEKDPARRFHSASDLSFYLEVLRAALARREAGRTGRPRRSRWVLPLLGLLVAATALVIVRRLPAGAEGSPRVQQLTFSRGEIPTARFAHDGRQVLYTGASAGETPRIYSTTVDRPDYRSLSLENAELLAASSRGDLAVALRPAWHRFEDGGRGTLAILPIVGGAPRELLEAVSYADWSPDGADLAVVHQVGSTSRLEYPVGKVLHESSGWLSHPRISPRGDRVAFIEHPSLYDYPGELMLVDASGRARVLARSTAQIAGVAWAPGGEEIWFTRDDEAPMSLWAVSLDGRSRLVYRGTSDLIVQDIAPDGRVLAVSFERRSKTGVIRPGTDQPVKDLSWLDQSILDDISNDGETILFSENDRVANLRRVDGADPVHLVDAKALGLSADGKWVLAIRAHDMPESRQLLILPTGAGHKQTLELTRLRLIRRARFAPDGRHVAVIARAEEAPGFAVHWVDRETGERRPLSPPDLAAYFLEISPDGRQVAAIGHGGALTLYPVAGGPAIPLLEPDESWVPAGWDASGNLFVRQLHALPARVFSFDLKTGARRPFATIAPPDATGVDWIIRLKVAANGGAIGFSYAVRQSKVLLLSWGDRPARP